MHKAVKEFCLEVKRNHPGYFVNKNILDVGSLDINGTNRYLFEGGSYFGIDLIKGRNVDKVININDLKGYDLYDVIICTEMLEHDRRYNQSLRRMTELLKGDGLLIITTAGLRREEHGTQQCHPKDSPATHDYYKNVTVDMICEGLNLSEFAWYQINYANKDIQFAGIKWIQ